MKEDSPFRELVEKFEKRFYTAIAFHGARDAREQAIGEMHTTIQKLAQEVECLTRTHGPLDFVEEALLSLRALLATPDSMGTEYRILNMAGAVEVLVFMVRQNPFHVMSDEFRRVAKIEECMRILRHVGDGDDTKSFTSIWRATKLPANPKTEWFIQQLIGVGLMTEQNNEGRWTQYFITPAGKTFLTNILSAAGKAYGF